MSPLGITASLRGALGEAHDAIDDLASAVRKLGERHAADHDVLHMSRTLGLKLGRGHPRPGRPGRPPWRLAGRCRA